jgi:hypothetical protein
VLEEANTNDQEEDELVVDENTYDWYLAMKTELAMLAELSGELYAHLKREGVPQSVTEDLVRMWFGAVLVKGDDE